MFPCQKPWLDEKEDRLVCQILLPVCGEQAMKAGLIRKNIWPPPSSMIVLPSWCTPTQRVIEFKIPHGFFSHKCRRISRGVNVESLTLTTIVNRHWRVNFGRALSDVYALFVVVVLDSGPGPVVLVSSDKFFSHKLE